MAAAIHVVWSGGSGGSCGRRRRYGANCERLANPSCSIGVPCGVSGMARSGHEFFLGCFGSRFQGKAMSPEEDGGGGVGVSAACALLPTSVHLAARLPLQAMY